jgi:4-diphosphocytidyl-2C-methyl-D-erythritol kinase
LITNSILLKAHRCNPSTQEVYKRDPEKEEQKFRNSKKEKKKKKNADCVRRCPCIKGFKHNVL